MKGFVSSFLRRVRSSRGFTATESILGIGVTALLVVGVCAATVNSSIATKETDTVEFFDNANQNAIAAFQSNAQKSALKNIAPFNDMQMEEKADGSVVFTGYYDANRQSTTETAAAYKIQYTATSTTTQRTNFSFSENELKLDIANYEKDANGNWILREHNQNMEGASSSGDAVTVRVISLNDDPDAADVTPKDPTIDPKIPVDPSDYQTITLTADLTGKRNYWDITRSKVTFDKKGDQLALTAKAESITNANTAEQDQNSYEANLEAISTLKSKIGDKPTHIVVEIHYSYVNVKSFLESGAGAGYTLAGTNGSADVKKYFDGTGADFTLDTAETQLTNIKKLLGCESNENVDLTLKPVPKEVGIGTSGDKVSNVTYAVRLILPGQWSGNLWDKIVDKGPFTIGLTKNGVQNGKLYYKVAIYNKDGQNIMGSRSAKFGSSDELSDYLYFGFGEKEIDNVTFYLYIDSPHVRFTGPQAAVSTKNVRSGSVNWFGSTRNVEVKEYKNMTAKNSDVTFDSVFFCQPTDWYSEDMMVDTAYFWMGENKGWWKGNSDMFGNVVDNSKLTWYAGQTEPKDRSEWKSVMDDTSASGGDITKDKSLLPSSFSLKKV